MPRHTQGEQTASPTCHSDAWIAGLGANMPNARGQPLQIYGDIMS